MEERLKAYNNIKAEISKLNWKIIKLENEDVQPTSPVLGEGGKNKKSYKVSSVENKVVNNRDEINMCKKQIAELEAEIKMIDSMINILKRIERQVIELKYFKNLSMEAIGATIDRQTITVIRLHNKAIDKMNKIYQK